MNVPVWICEDISWAAGLFEGEGCISIAENKYPTLTLGSTDRDVVDRFHQTFGFGKLSTFDPKRKGSLGTKLQYRWRVGDFEHCQAAVAAMWPWLGERRRARWVEVATLYRNRPTPQGKHYRKHGIPHGTYTGYRNHNCRCEPCKTAANADQRRRRQARKERG